MEIEDAAPVDDSLLLTISIAGFLVMGTSIYWIFFRERNSDDDEDTTGHHNNNNNSRAARRAQAREERKQSDGNHHHRKQQKRRPFVPESSSGREVVDTAAAAKRELELKRKQREEEAAAAFACFYGKVSVDELATQRVLDIEELSVTCGASAEQVRQRIEVLISSKRWAGFFQENSVEVDGSSDAIKDDVTNEKTRKNRLHFVRIFDDELQLIADFIKERQRVALSDVAEIMQQIIDDGKTPGE